jgi:hypothetical protein
MDTRIEWRKLDIETASCRQSATTRAWGSIGSVKIFAGHSVHNDKVGRATLDWPDTGRAWWRKNKTPFFPHILGLS